jgi:hypothetical protein
MVWIFLDSYYVILYLKDYSYLLATQEAPFPPNTGIGKRLLGYECTTRVCVYDSLLGFLELDKCSQSSNIIK